MAYLKRIKNPHLSQYIISFSQGNKVIIMSKYIEGENFDVFKGKGPQIILHDLKKILSGCLQGLLTLHENGIVHNDVRGQNIIIKPDFNSVIIDFGISCSFAKKLINNGVKPCLDKNLYKRDIMMLGAVFKDFGKTYKKGSKERIVVEKMLDKKDKSDVRELLGVLESP